MDSGGGGGWSHVHIPPELLAAMPSAASTCEARASLDLLAVAPVILLGADSLAAATTCLFLAR